MGYILYVSDYIFWILQDTSIYTLDIWDTKYISNLTFSERKWLEDGRSVLAALVKIVTISTRLMNARSTIYPWISSTGPILSPCWHALFWDYCIWHSRGIYFMDFSLNLPTRDYFNCWYIMNCTTVYSVLLLYMFNTLNGPPTVSICVLLNNYTYSSLLKCITNT